MQLAILGTGAVGPALGKAFSSAGHDVVIGTRDPVQTKQREQWAGIDLQLAAYEDLEAEVFINATNGAGALPALQAVGDALNGKVVIDTSNPLDFSQGSHPHSSSATPIHSSSSYSANCQRPGWCRCSTPWRTK